MNKEQEQIIDEVYEKYSIIAGMSTWFNISLLDSLLDFNIFVNLAKTNL